MRGSDSWVWERWERLNAIDAAAMQAGFGDRDLCESCQAKKERDNAPQAESVR